MTAQTPLFGIKYIAVGEPIRNTRQALEDNANTIEAALAQRVNAPTVPDLNAEVTARTAAVAGEVTARTAADFALSNRITAVEATALPPSPATGATKVTYQGGCSDYTGANWSGVWYYRRGSTVTVCGAMTFGALAASATVFTLPVGFRPPVQIQDALGQLIIRADGTVITTIGRTAGNVSAVLVSFGIA